MRIAEAQTAIEEAMEKDGGYSHNVIQTTLRLVAKEHGTREANKLVDEYDLFDIYGIKKVPE